MLDYHIHPNYSIDAEDFSMEDYCKRGLELGLKEICFTPHYEFDPVREQIDWFARLGGKVVHIGESWLDEYFREGRQLQERYSQEGIAIKLGLEVGYDVGLEEAIAKVVEAYPFDLVLGSVHCIDHVAISSAQESSEYLPGTNLDDVVTKYYKTLARGVESGLFDVVAHLDLYRRHGAKCFGEQAYRAYQGYVEPILESMAKRGLGLEINTSSIKQGQNEFYPSKEIVRLAWEKGIRIFTTGSDAHRLRELGQGIEQAENILREFDCVPASFVRRRPVTDTCYRK